MSSVLVVFPMKLGCTHSKEALKDSAKGDHGVLVVGEDAVTDVVVNHRVPRPRLVSCLTTVQIPWTPCDPGASSS